MSASSSIPSWDEDPIKWDTLKLVGTGAPFIVPGLLKSIKVSKAQKVDVKPIPGGDGATITFKGYEPAKVDVEIVLWNEDQWERWQGVIRVLQPRPGKALPETFGIIHPQVEIHGIKRVVVLGLDGPDREEQGMYRFSLKFLEYIPGKAAASNATKTPVDLTRVNADTSLPGVEAPKPVSIKPIDIVSDTKTKRTKP